MPNFRATLARLALASDIRDACHMRRFARGHRVPYWDAKIDATSPRLARYSAVNSLLRRQAN